MDEMMTWTEFVWDYFGFEFDINDMSERDEAIFSELYADYVEKFKED